MAIPGINSFPIHTSRTRAQSTSGRPETPETISAKLSDPATVRGLVTFLNALGAARREAFQPAVAILKQNPSQLYESGDLESLRLTLQRFFQDKSFDPEAAGYLRRAGILGSLFSNLVLRDRDFADISNIWLERTLNYPVNSVVTNRGKVSFLTTPPYIGTPEENKKIDEAIANSDDKETPKRQSAGRGATRLFKASDIERLLLRELLFSNIKVIVIGAGPAGLMATRGLIELGFDSKNITVLDKSGKYGGIWRHKNVYEGTKNNPVQFNFEDIILGQAPGPGSTVNEFLSEIVANGKLGSLPKPVAGTVTSVQPGDLDHTVIYKDSKGNESSISAPIVINAIGTGKPLHPSREGYMTTDTPDRAGIRWQMILTKEMAEKYRNKRLVFIGLGNSTAEMLVQINKLNYRGYNIGYSVITHYPKEAVRNPKKEIEFEGKKYQVFRDTSAPNLVKYEGDLPDAKTAYFLALSSGRIVPNVVHWDFNNGLIDVYTKNNSSRLPFLSHYPCDQLFTLIGYGQDPENLKSMGMKITDDYLGAIAYDYDGEIQRNPGIEGRERLYPGYFGIGAILKNSSNPNAVVMPGIMHRMYDLLFSAAIRGIEYKKRERLLT